MILLPNHIVRWIGILIIALSVMSIMVIFMSGIVIYTVLSERGVHLAAMDKAGKALEAMDQKLALREEHIRYLETHINPIRDEKRDGKKEKR